MRPPHNETPRKGRISEVAPRVKLATALVLVTATTLMPRRPDLLYAVPATVLMVLWTGCRMPLRYAAGRLLLAEFFILGIGLLSLTVPSSRPVVLAAVIKSNLCVLTLLLLTWTTPFYEILAELRRLRLPAVMLTTLALMYRYLPVVGEESHRMQRARASRTFAPGRRLVWRNLTTIIGKLFVRSADRAERIYLAMCSRGWK